LFPFALHVIVVVDTYLQGICFDLTEFIYVADAKMTTEVEFLRDQGETR